MNLGSIFGDILGGVAGLLIPGGNAVTALTGAGIGGGLFGSQQAAQTQANYGQQGLDLQRQIFQQTQQNLAPWMTQGQQAINPINALLGIGPAGAAGSNEALLNSPAYQWASNQGQNAIMNQRSAMGGALSGGTLRDLEQYQQGLASQQFGNVFNRLLSVSGQGQNAAAGLGGLGANYANQSAAGLQGIGNVLGAGIQGGQGAIQGGINNWLLASALQQGAGQGQFNPSLLGYYGYNTGSGGAAP